MSNLSTLNNILNMLSCKPLNENSMSAQLVDLTAVLNGNTSDFSALNTPTTHAANIIKPDQSIKQQQSDIKTATAAASSSSNNNHATSSKELTTSTSQTSSFSLTQKRSELLADWNDSMNDVSLPSCFLNDLQSPQKPISTLKPSILNENSRDSLFFNVILIFIFNFSIQYFFKFIFFFAFRLIHWI